jgi:hypothetical protein
MAREARNLLREKSTCNLADSITETANILAVAGKLQITPLLHWANAEVAIKNKDFKSAFKSASEAMKSSSQELSLQERGELAIVFARTCQYTGQFSTSIEVLRKNIEFAKSNNLKHILPQTCLGLSEVYTVVNKPEETIAALNEMLLYAEQENDLGSANLANSRLGLQGG